MESWRCSKGGGEKQSHSRPGYGAGWLVSRVTVRVTVRVTARVAKVSPGPRPADYQIWTDRFRAC